MHIPIILQAIMNIRLCFFLIIAAVIATTCPRPACQTAVVTLDDVQTVDDVEGYWELTAGGALLEFRRTPGKSGSYDIFLIDSPDYTVVPGTKLGSMDATAVAGKFDVILAADPRRGPGGKSRRFIFDIENGKLRMSAYKVGKTVNIYRLLPYLFRVGIRDTGNRPEGIDGAIRTAPRGNTGIITL